MSDVPTSDEVTDAVLIDAETGIQETIVDGTTVRAMDPIKRLDVLDRIDRRTASTKKHGGLRFSQFVPGGGN